MFRFTQNHHQGATASAYLKLHVWYQCTNIDVVSVMEAYAAITQYNRVTQKNGNY